LRDDFIGTSFQEQSEKGGREKGTAPGQKMKSNGSDLKKKGRREAGGKASSERLGKPIYRSSIRGVGEELARSRQRRKEGDNEDRDECSERLAGVNRQLHASDDAIR